jgi:hypothetical protein
VRAGLAVHHVLTAILQTTLGNDTPRKTLDVFTAPQVASVLLAGLVVATLAAAIRAVGAAHTGGAGAALPSERPPRRQQRTDKARSASD